MSLKDIMFYLCAVGAALLSIVILLLLLECGYGYNIQIDPMIRIGR